MKYLLYIFIISVSSFFIIGDCKADVAESKLKCISSEEDYPVYFHIIPEVKSMIERNSTLRDKGNGEVFIYILRSHDKDGNLLNQNQMVEEKKYKITESTDKKYYEGMPTDGSFGNIYIDREALLISVYDVSGKLRCSILSKEIDLHNEITKVIKAISRTIDYELEEQVKKNVI